MRGRKAKLIRNMARLMAGSISKDTPEVSYIPGSPPEYETIGPPIIPLPKLFKIKRGVPTRLGKCQRLLQKRLKGFYKLSARGQAPVVVNPLS